MPAMSLATNIGSYLPIHLLPRHRHFFHDMVHWRALDPSDIQPDEWLSDVAKYNLWCPMGHLRIPQDEADEEKMKKALDNVNSRAACTNFVHDTL